MKCHTSRVSLNCFKSLSVKVLSVKTFETTLWEGHGDTMNVDTHFGSAARRPAWRWPELTLLTGGHPEDANKIPLFPVYLMSWKTLQTGSRIVILFISCFLAAIFPAVIITVLLMFWTCEPKPTCRYFKQMKWFRFENFWHSFMEIYIHLNIHDILTAGCITRATLQHSSVEFVHKQLEYNWLFPTGFILVLRQKTLWSLIRTSCYNLS